MAYDIREIRDSTGHLLLIIDIHGNIIPVALDPPAAPTPGAATAGDITGTAYQWSCTIVNTQGETTLSAKTLATDLTDQHQSLTMPATAPDDCTFNLYRNKTGGSIWFQVTTGLGPGAIYVDDTLDAALGAVAPTGNSTAPNVGRRFSGAFYRDVSGITLPGNGASGIPPFAVGDMVYDTDAYLQGDVLRAPFNGYYRLTGFAFSDQVVAPVYFVGVDGGSDPKALFSGTGELQDGVNGGVAQTKRIAAGDTMDVVMGQYSGTDQLFYGWLQVEYLGPA